MSKKPFLSAKLYCLAVITAVPPLEFRTVIVLEVYGNLYPVGAFMLLEIPPPVALLPSVFPRPVLLAALQLAFFFD